MTDTNPKIASKYRQLIMTKSPEDRLIMGFSMFDTAKEIVTSSILNENPKISPKRLKEEMFLRFYGMEFGKDEKDKILNVLSNAFY